MFRTVSSHFRTVSSHLRTVSSYLRTVSSAKRRSELKMRTVASHDLAYVSVRARRPPGWGPPSPRTSRCKRANRCDDIWREIGRRRGIKHGKFSEIFHLL